MSALNTLRHWARDLVRYPTFKPADASYDEYWSERDMDSALNAFQRDRVNYIAGLIGEADSVTDIGCGDGRILAELLRRKPRIVAFGIDSSNTALERARRRGISVLQTDIRKLQNLDLPLSDWVLLLEVIEHMVESEELIAFAQAHVRRGVIFSVPNTGFLTHRLRLLLGRFPLQWRAHPAEHVRFWTLRDMRYWLSSLHYAYSIEPYQGIPFLNRMWPSLFAAGLMVVIPPRT